MIPRATYRLQFHKGFPFEAAIPLAPYFARLGISHIYSSPILKSRAGSRHGYDVIDHGVIDTEIGGEAGFRRLAAALRDHDLGIVLDIVPNHMAVHNDNRWWMDVLERGEASPHATYFDIDWDMHDGKVLAAFLGRPYWQALEAGEVKVCKDARGKRFVSYFDWRFPIRPEDQRDADSAAESIGALHRLLERQHYRLAWWRCANDEINWRRFFDIPDLIALNQNLEDVFEATHAKIFSLYAEGLIDGVRVDHIDGLSDPAAYGRRLRARLEQIGQNCGRTGAPYIIVEKILGAGEELPSDWAVDGTTGYDFMNDVSALQHDPAGAAPLAQAWHRIGGRSPEFEDEERLARGEIAHRAFESALSRTALAFARMAQSARSGRDLSTASLRRAIVRILQQLRVYRTYAMDHPGSPEPGGAFARAVAAAKRNATGADAAAIDFIAATMSGAGEFSATERDDAVRPFNQLSAPVAAKAVEDTAFYRYGRLLSRNDVGFHPGTLAIRIGEFHARNARRASSFPHTLLTTATHDHKRGEDARARLAVLSEIPEEWERAVEAWLALNTHLRTPGLDPGDEYQLYQTLVGAWPLDLAPDDLEGLETFRNRILAWRLKSLHEAKLRTSWLDPDIAYETANEDFVRALLNRESAADFLQSLHDFVAKIAPGAALNGLVQAALRCTAPGVPDCYQGTEFWDFSLVDPDNRRKVDYKARIASLSSEARLPDVLPEWRNGRVKQMLLSAVLNLRKNKPALFVNGAYLPLEVYGPRGNHVVAFIRGNADQSVLIAVPVRCARECSDLPLPDPKFWGDTHVVVPKAYRHAWKNIVDGAELEGDTLACRALFARFPVAVLV